MSQSRQASREPGAPTLPATINLNDISVATVSRKPLRRLRTQIGERLFAIEIPAPESRRLDRLYRTASQPRDHLHTSGFTMRLQSVEIPVVESQILSKPSRRAVISTAESSRVDRKFCKAFIPLPGSRKADRPSRRAFKRPGFLELGEFAQQATPILSISGGHSMTEDNLSVHSWLESSSGSVITRIIAQLCVISPFRIPRSLGYRQLLRSLRCSQGILSDLLRSTRSTRSTAIVQRALRSNVGHLAVRSVGAQTYPVDDILRRKTALSSENAQAAPGTNFGHVAVRSIGTQSSPVDDIPNGDIALDSEHVGSSDSGQPAQILMRQARRRAHEASIKENACKLDKPRSQEELRPQPVLKSILKKRGPPPLSEPLYRDPHILFRNFEEGNVLRSARKSKGKLRSVAAITHSDRCEGGQPPEMPNLNLTGTFRVPSPSSSEDSELSEVKCGADLGSSRAELEAITSNIELSLAGFQSRRAELQETGVNYEQELGKCPATAVEVPQTERSRGSLVETQEGAQPFDDRTHNEAGLNFERMRSEPSAELMVVDDLCSRSAVEYLANRSQLGGVQFNSMRTEANRQVADADFARANDFNQASLTPTPILSGPTAEGDEQDAMDTSLDIVETKAVFDRVPFNAADEYLATKTPRVRAYLDSLFTEEHRRVAVEDFANEMERYQVQAEPAPIMAVPTPDIVDLVQEAHITDSRATTIVRAPLDTYLTMISPEIRAHVDSMWTESAEHAAIASFAREFAIFQACENLSGRMRE